MKIKYIYACFWSFTVFSAGIEKNKPLDRLLNLKTGYEYAKELIAREQKIKQELYEKQKMHMQELERKYHEQEIDRLIQKNQKIEQSLQQLASLEKNLTTAKRASIEKQLRELETQKENVFKDMQSAFEHKAQKIFNKQIKTLDSQAKAFYENLIIEPSSEPFEYKMKRLRKLIILALSMMAFMRMYAQDSDKIWPAQFGWINNLFESLAHELQLDQELLTSFDYATDDFKKKVDWNPSMPFQSEYERAINHIDALDHHYKRIYQQIQKYSQADLDKVNVKDLQITQEHIKNIPSSLKQLAR